jgi:hypothetical protein
MCLGLDDDEVKERRMASHILPRNCSTSATSIGIFPFITIMAYSDDFILSSANKKWLTDNDLVGEGAWVRSGMSNSNPCAGRTVIFNDNKTFSGPQFCKIQQNFTAQ